MPLCCGSRASSCGCQWGSTSASTCARFFAGRPGSALGRICPSSRRCAEVSLDGGPRDAKQLHNLGGFRGPSPRLAEHARVHLVSMPSWIPSWQKTALAARRSDDPSGSRRLLLPEAFCVHGTSAICTSENSMALAKRVSSGDQARA